MIFPERVRQMPENSGIPLEHDCIGIVRDLFKLQGIGCCLHSKFRIFLCGFRSKYLFYLFSVMRYVHIGEGRCFIENHYVCNNYKSNRGTCTAHYIREDVLREIVLERIRAVNVYIRSDVDGFQEEWLQCRRTDQERSIRDDKKKLEQAKKRLADLDVIISRLYEDYVLGNLNQDRYRKMSADYEAEQERLKLEIEVTEEWVEQREEMNDGLDAFIALTQKYVDVEELTQTIVNEYIKKIVVYAPDKSGGKRTQKVKIYFNFVDDVDIPVISEPIITQTTYERRKTA